MLKYTKIFAIFFVVILSSGQVKAQALHPIVIELFTSQGCSSCPPAEKILTYLDQNQNDVIILAYHVDYWDYLGWKDTFSLPESTARQKAYVEKFQSDLYTPQMIVQGKYQASGVSSKEMVDAMNSGFTDFDWMEFSAKNDSDKVKISIGEKKNINASIYLIGFQSHAKVKIERGENAGKEMELTNSVVEIRKLADWKGEKYESTESKPKGDGAVVLIQDNATLAILGASYVE